jgi:hypothetical protein
LSNVLPLLEYCSPVWSSAAVCHLCLMDRIVHRAVALSDGKVICDLVHMRKVASLCMFYKVFNNPYHPVRHLLPPPYVPTRFTRHSDILHSFTLRVARCNTVQ